MLVGKEKFFTVNRSWNETNGARDVTGVDDGVDKVDRIYKQATAELIELALIELERPDLEYLFLHIRDPDSAGHSHGWGTVEYAKAVVDADRAAGEVIDAVRNDPALAETTAIVVVSDHGGVNGETSHADALNPENHTIPFIVWGPGVESGADLYELNPDRSPEDNPIRMHDLANTAMSMLGYPSVPGSDFNFDQDLRVG
jgi:predicted AlkP superfamily pyrophosphatase or phosphodiesterase